MKTEIIMMREGVNMFAEYLQPTTVQEAITLLRQHGQESKLIAGGTDLMVEFKGQSEGPTCLIDITTIPDLDYVKENEKGLTVGALTPIRTLEQSSLLQQKYPLIADAAAKLGCMAVRNVATLGGNICNGAPSADLALPLLLLDASVQITGPDTERSLPIKEFWTGPGRTALKPDEIVTGFAVPKSEQNMGCFLKHTRRRALDIAMVSIGALLVLEPGTSIIKKVRLALGAVAPTPVRAESVEATIEGQKLDAELATKVSTETVKIIQPRANSYRVSAEHRRQLVAALTKRAFMQLLQQSRFNS